jgi:hypothetical protein
VLDFVPEGGISVGVRFTPHIQAMAGYSFLWWNRVVRPGAQIDPGVNGSLVPVSQQFGTGTGPARPTFTFNDESFWMHAITLGLEFAY